MTGGMHGRPTVDRFCAGCGAFSSAFHFFRMRTRAWLKSTQQFIHASFGIICCGLAAFT